jgi:hypothetical protein
MDEYDAAQRVEVFYQSENSSVTVGTYTGESNFSSTLENDVDDSYLAPICTENTVIVTIESDGIAHGEIRSICYAKKDTDNVEMQTTHHSEVTGVIQGELLDNTGQLSIAYTWHSYLTSPQWETTSLDKTVDFVFPYHVQVSGNVMTLTPAAEVEDYYNLELTKQSGPEGSEAIDESSSSSTTADSEVDLPEWIRNGQAYIEERGRNEIQVPEWLDWIKPQPDAEQIFGVLTPVDGEIWVYSRSTQKWKGPAKAGDSIGSGDIVVVGEDSSTKILITQEPWGGELILSDLAALRVPLPAKDTDYPTLWYLYSGAIRFKRSLMGEPPPPPMNPPPMYATDHDVIVGARSEFVFSHDPETHTSTIYLIEGEIDYYNLVAAGPDDGSISSGQKVVITGDGSETLSTFDETELDTFLNENRLNDVEPLSEKETEHLSTEDLDGQRIDANKNAAVKLIIFGAIMCVIIVFGLGVVIAIPILMSRKKTYR